MTSDLREEEEIGHRYTQKEDHEGTQEEDSHQQAKREASGGAKPANFYPLELRGSQFLLFQPPGAWYLLWRLQQTSSKAGHHHCEAKGKTHETDDQASCETVFKK